MQSVVSAKSFKSMISNETGLLKMLWSVLPGVAIAALTATVGFEFSNFQAQIKSTIILESLQKSADKRDGDFESLRTRVDRLTTDIAELKVQLQRNRN
jgi:hypothetical protein